MGLLLAPVPRQQFAGRLRQALADWRKRLPA
jgi:hypothetical protein